MKNSHWILEQQPRGICWQLGYRPWPIRNMVKHRATQIRRFSSHLLCPSHHLGQLFQRILHPQPCTFLLELGVRRLATASHAGSMSCSALLSGFSSKLKTGSVPAAQAGQKLHIFSSAMQCHKTFLHLPPHSLGASKDATSHPHCLFSWLQASIECVVVCVVQASPGRRPNGMLDVAYGRRTQRGCTPEGALRKRKPHEDGQEHCQPGQSPEHHVSDTSYMFHIRDALPESNSGL